MIGKVQPFFVMVSLSLPITASCDGLHEAFLFWKGGVKMHETYMSLAIQEALKGAGKTFTNPLVGAVIVSENQVIAIGSHLTYGQPHAERNAIASCKTPEKLFNSTIYVTLEPCHHYGKQPPCTKAIVESGIKRVVIGQLDPNPLVAGQGKHFLEEHGIEVISGVMTKEVQALNSFYNFFYEHQRPYITLKQAISLDGKIALDGKRTPITGEAAVKKVHEERGDYQAILVGSQTVLTDNPTLKTTKDVLFPPLRVILDRKGRTLNHPELKLFQEDGGSVVIFTEQTTAPQSPKWVEVVSLPEVTIDRVITELEQRGIQSLYVEGGAKIHDAFLASGLWDEVITYMAPKLIGGNSTASFSSERTVRSVTDLKNITVESIGEDLRISGRRA